MLQVLSQKLYMYSFRMDELQFQFDKPKINAIQYVLILFYVWVLRSLLIPVFGLLAITMQCKLYHRYRVHLSQNLNHLGLLKKKNPH